MEYLFISWKELKCPREYEIIKSYAENNRRFILLYSSENYHWIIHLYRFYHFSHTFEHCSISVLNNFSISINTSRTVGARCNIASQWIPSYIVTVSVVLLRGHRKIFFSNLFTCICGLAVYCNWNDSPRLHIYHLCRAYLQFVCCNWVNNSFYNFL